MDFTVIAVLGFIMGIVTSISGGAGVFAVPTLLALGFSPINTLALNRSSDLGVVFGALHKYNRSKNIDWKLSWKIMIPLVLGSAVGASFIVQLSDELIEKIIIVGVVIGIFFLLKKPNTKVSKKSSKRFYLGLFLMLLVGAWSGAIAMGGATFASLVLVYLFGKNYLQARSTDIVAAIPETVVSASILIYNATLGSSLFLIMATSSFLGAYVGSHFAVKYGGDFIRKGMVIIAILMIIKVLSGY